MIGVLPSRGTRQALWGLVVALGVLVVGVGAVAAQAEEEGGELLEVSGWTAVLTLLVATAILLASVELLIHALVRTAVRFGISAFLMAVIFSGWEFDNVAVGLFTGFDELQNVAFGLAIGNAVSIFGVTLAAGAIVFPFVVDVPNDYIVMTLAAPLLLVPVLLSGTLTPVLSVMFIILYIVIFAYIVQKERDLARTFMQSDEVREAVAATDGQETSDLPEPFQTLARYKWFWPSMLLVAIIGIVIGAEGSSTAVEGIISTWNLSGTFVGVTILTVLFTLDDLLLVLEPLRLGYTDVAVGGIIGSLLFFVTANVGIIGLIGDIHFRWETVFFHLPVLGFFTVLGAFLLWRGKLTRAHGAAMLTLYIVYLGINIRYFATLPVGG